MVVTVRALTRRLRHLHVPFNPSACQALAASPHFDKKAAKVGRCIGQRKQELSAFETLGNRPPLLRLKGHAVTGFEHVHRFSSGLPCFGGTWARRGERKPIRAQQGNAHDVLTCGTQAIEDGLAHGWNTTLRCISLPAVLWASGRASANQDRPCNSREVALRRSSLAVRRIEWPLDCRLVPPTARPSGLRSVRLERPVPRLGCQGLDLAGRRPRRRPPPAVPRPERASSRAGREADLVRGRQGLPPDRVPAA